MSHHALTKYQRLDPNPSIQCIQWGHSNLDLSNTDPTLIRTISPVTNIYTVLFLLSKPDASASGSGGPYHQQNDVFAVSIASLTRTSLAWLC